MKLGRVAAAALMAVAVAAKPAWAWDELGHRVVARFAWDHMTPQARAAAVRLLMNAPANTGLQALVPAGLGDEERGRELFVMAAVWPDVIRSRTNVGYRYAHSDWHYVDHFWEQRAPGAPPVDRPDMPLDGQLLTQLPRLSATLGDPAASDSARSVALAWVLHLVGDAHQPLHNSSRISPEDPKGDRGGNSFALAGLYPRSNLHAYWDALAGFNEPWRPGDVNEAAYVGSIARTLAAQYTDAWARPRLFPRDFERWSREGLTLSETRLYPAWLVRGQPIPDRYRAWAWSAGAPRLALAGYRLADLLNHFLGA